MLGVSEVLPLGCEIFQRSTVSISQKEPGRGGEYSLGCPVPAWVGLDIVLNDVTVEKNGTESGATPGLFLLNVCACPTWSQRREVELDSRWAGWDLGEPGWVTEAIPNGASQEPAGPTPRC